MARFEKGNKAAVGRKRRGTVRRHEALVAMEDALLEWETERVIAARKRLNEEAMLEMSDEELAEAIPHDGSKHAAMKSFFKLVLRFAQFGDSTAQKMMMDRIAPRGRLPLVRLGNMTDLEPDKAAQHVAEVMAQGGMTPDTAKACVEVFMMNAEIAHYQAETRLAKAMAEAEEKGLHEDQA